MKKTITYNKLVRDNIPDIIQKDHKSCMFHVLDSKQYIDELNKKLIEEINEYEESKEIEELADIQEIIDSILKAKGISEQEFKDIQNKKKIKNGSFDKRIFLESVTKE